MDDIHIKILVGFLEESRLFLPPLQMRHYKHHPLLFFFLPFSLSSYQEIPQSLHQRLVQMSMIHYIRSQDKIVLPPNRRHVIHVPPAQLRHIHFPAGGGNYLRVRRHVKLQVSDDAR
uniref:Uncharacterized protein n=1 Tax=Opuntia streptacantha TaxID=393608 RepID=A0A7C9ET19_OPUST